jgi:cardiolipin synthase
MKPATTTSTSPNFELLPARSYYERLVQDINRAERRITLVSLLMLSGPLMDRVFAALEAAATRGVKTRLVFDAFTWYYVGGRLPFHPLRDTNPGREDATRATLSRLREAGVDITEIGTIIHANPYRGRCHTKLSVIDDHAYSFGGVNLYDEAFRDIDFMLALTDSTIADRLDALASEIAAGIRPDHELPLGPDTTAIIDGGFPGHSLIYDHATYLAEQAKRIQYVSQFCPTGRLARTARHSHATCYFNRLFHAPLHIGLMVTIERFAHRIRNHYRRASFLHAKFILFELPDGSRALITGSHNFSWHGVDFGTQEIALVSFDKRLWKQLDHFLQTEISVGRATHRA